MPAPIQANSLADLLKIRSFHRDKILAASRRLGSAVGYKISNGVIDRSKPAIIVFVPLKAAPGIVPPELLLPETLSTPAGLFCHTDVIETSRGATATPQPLSAENQALVKALGDGKIGIVGGIRIFSGAGSTSGTAACAVKFNDTGQLGLLTNRHVAQTPGMRVNHPTAKEFEIGAVAQSFFALPDEVRFPGIIDDPGALYRADCASIRLHDHTEIAVKPGVHGIGPLGQPTSFDLATMGPVGMAVTSIGSTRGRQSGTVIGVGYRHTDVPNPNHTDMIVLGAENTTFAVDGDSGKLIVSDDGTNSPIGLLWGGEPFNIRNAQSLDSIGFVTDINWVLKILNVSIYDGSPASNANLIA